MLFNFWFNFIFAYMKYWYYSKSFTYSVQLHQNLRWSFPTTYSFIHLFSQQTLVKHPCWVSAGFFSREQTRWQSLAPWSLHLSVKFGETTLQTDNLCSSPLHLLFLSPFVSLLFSRDSAWSRSCKWSWAVKEKENFPLCLFRFSLNSHDITKLLNIAEAEFIHMKNVFPILLNLG